MAVGDVISGSIVGVGNFQPAAGVEVTILVLDEAGGAITVSFYDGATASAGKAVAALTSVSMPLTNTLYLRNITAVNTCFYAGVQTK